MSQLIRAELATVDAEKRLAREEIAVLGEKLLECQIQAKAVHAKMTVDLEIANGLLKIDHKLRREAELQQGIAEEKAERYRNVLEKLLRYGKGEFKEFNEPKEFTDARAALEGGEK